MYLLAALLEAPDPPLARALGDAQARAHDLYRQALAFAESGAASQRDAGRDLEALLHELLRTAREKHGVAIRITPEAAAFVAEQARHPSPDGRALEHAAERWVQAPLDMIVAAGKIRKHPAWRLVYDEGGVYLLPDRER